MFNNKLTRSKKLIIHLNLPASIKLTISRIDSSINKRLDCRAFLGMRTLFIAHVPENVWLLIAGWISREFAALSRKNKGGGTAAWGVPVIFHGLLGPLEPVLPVKISNYRVQKRRPRRGSPSVGGITKTCTGTPCLDVTRCTWFFVPRFSLGISSTPLADIIDMTTRSWVRGIAYRSSKTDSRQ